MTTNETPATPATPAIDMRVLSETIGNRTNSVDVRMNALRTAMTASKAKLQAYLGPTVNVDTCMTVACNAVRKNPGLLDCTVSSLFNAIIEAASYKWVVDGVQGHCYIVPFNNNSAKDANGRKITIKEAKLMPGYKGLRDLVRRSREADTNLEMVFEGDTFEFRGTYEPVRHIKSTAPNRRFAKLLHVYVEVRFFNPPLTKTFTMSREQCIAHRNQYSKGWKAKPNKDNPWHEENPGFAVMCLKTVMRDVVNRGEVPMSIDDKSMFDRDEVQPQSTVTTQPPAGLLGDDYPTDDFVTDQEDTVLGDSDGGDDGSVPGDESATDDSGNSASAGDPNTIDGTATPSKTITLDEFWGRLQSATAVLDVRKLVQESDFASDHDSHQAAAWAAEREDTIRASRKGKV